LKVYDNPEVFMGIISQNQQKPGYMPGIDGLRALAVFAVILYHFRFSFTAGGFLGVTLFFVLSGYLITDLLLNEWDNKGKISLAKFWSRRAKRLLPGLFVLLLTLGTFVTLFRPDLMNKLRPDMLAAVFYYSNWWDIFHKISYFDNFGTPPLLNHLWTLAVEEQFYILWPLLMIAGLKVCRSHKRVLAGAILFGALLSAAVMALLYVPGMDPSRVYYGTDTRAFSLLLGAVAAFIMPSRKLLAMSLSGGKRLALNLVGIAGLIAFFAFVVFSDEYNDFLYRGGMLLFSAFCVPLILSAAHPETLLSRIFRFDPLRRIGAYSYEIYLFQFPVIAIFSPAVNTNGINLWLCAAQVLATLLLAWLTYHFIDNPIRRKEFHRKSSEENQNQKTGALHHVYISIIGGLVIVMLLTTVIGTSGWFTLPLLGSKQNKTSSSTTENSSTAYTTSPPTSLIPESSSSVPTTLQNSTEPSGGTGTSSPRVVSMAPDFISGKTLSDKRITVIGDSIMIDVEGFLKPEYPHMLIQCKVGFQIWHAYDEIQEIEKNRNLGDIVIVELGTNGYCTKSTLYSIVNEIGNDRKIIFCSARIPGYGQAAINRNIRDVVMKTPNTVLADWYTVSTHHNEYFVRDGVHTTFSGSEAFAAMLQSAIAIAVKD